MNSKEETLLSQLRPRIRPLVYHGVETMLLCQIQGYKNIGQQVPTNYTPQVTKAIMGGA